MTIFMESEIERPLLPMQPGDLEVFFAETWTRFPAQPDGEAQSQSFPPQSFRSLHIVASWQNDEECRELLRAALNGFNYIRIRSVIFGAATWPQQLANAIFSRDADLVTVLALASSGEGVVLEASELVREIVRERFRQRLALAATVRRKASESLIDHVQSGVRLLQAIVLQSAPHRMPDCDISDLADVLRDGAGASLVIWEPTRAAGLFVPSRTERLLRQAKRVAIIGSDHPQSLTTARDLVDAIRGRTNDLEALYISLAVCSRDPIANAIDLRAAVVITS